MATVIQSRRDTLANWASTNPILAAGEIGLESDTVKIKFGNGTSHWNDLPYFSGISGTTPVKGTAVIDFGSSPGNNIATVTVSNVNVLTASKVMVFMDTVATATHNAYEHAVVPVQLTAGGIVNQTSFVITAVSQWSLTGTFNVAYLITN
jgi:hypothetical protein